MGCFEQNLQRANVACHSFSSLSSFFHYRGTLKCSLATHFHRCSSGKIKNMALVSIVLDWENMMMHMGDFFQNHLNRFQPNKKIPQVATTNALSAFCGRGRERSSPPLRNPFCVVGPLSLVWTRMRIINLGGQIMMASWGYS